MQLKVFFYIEDLLCVKYEMYQIEFSKPGGQWALLTQYSFSSSKLDNMREALEKFGET